MPETRLEARRRIPAPAAAVWELVSRPEGHVRIDGSGMLEAALDAKPLTAVGDTFDMAMDREPLGDVPLGKYEVRNWVTAIEPGRLLEWGTNLAKSDGPVGHTYGWIIEPVGEDECEVVNYTDWSLLPEVHQRRWPIVPQSMLEETVAKLERVVTEREG